MPTWSSDACFTALRKPLPLLLGDLYASSCTLVTFFCVSALAHGTAFVRWKCQSKEEKQKGWALYGWFTGLSFCGSIAGALAYACRMLQLKGLFIFFDLETIVNPTLAQLQQMQSTRSEVRRWAASHYALFPFELGLVVLAKLLILHRTQLSAGTSHPERWRKARLGLLGVVVLLSALGICSNFGAASYYIQASALSADSADAFAANNSAKGKELRGAASQKSSLAESVASIQRFSEVSILMLIIAAFTTVGFFSAQVIASALRTLFSAQQRLVSVAGAAGEQGRQLVADASLQGRQLQRKVLGTFVFVFMSVLVRSVFIVTYAVAQALQNTGDPCGSNYYCDPCKNVYANIQGWIVCTPAVQQVAVLIASPIALLVALWGMSGVRALEQIGAQRAIVQSRRNISSGGSINAEL